MAAVHIAAGSVVVSGALGTRFKVQRLLGAGAYGEVWLGRDHVSGERRALKIISNDKADTANPEIERNRRATLACGAYHVPNFYDASRSCLEGQKQSFLMIVMEFIDGPTLEHLVSGGLPPPCLRRDAAEEVEPRLPPPCATRVLLRDVLLALSRLHRVGVIHCDVKGANILVSREGNSYLCDFGASQFADDFRPGDRMPQVGTPFYMAPEMLKSNEDGHCRYDAKVDVWSLGVLAYELTRGLTPAAEHYKKESEGKLINPKKEVVWQFIMSSPPAVPLHDERCTPELAAFMQKSLVYGPEFRSSAVELVQDCFDDLHQEDRRTLEHWVATSPH